MVRKSGACVWGVLITAVVGCVVGVSEVSAQEGEPLEFNRDEFMVTLHTRASWAPSPVLDLWFDEHARSWSGGQRNATYGGQFTWRSRNDYELGVSLDYAELSLPSEFWLQRGDSVSKSKFTEVDLQMFSVVFTSYWFWDPLPWLSPYLGVGLGAGMLRGAGITEYQAVEGSACAQGLGQGESFTPQVCYGEGGEGDPTQVDRGSGRPADRVPPVVPVLHLAGGLRFNIMKHGVLRLEVGFNDYTYVGLSAGVQWW